MPLCNGDNFVYKNAKRSEGGGQLVVKVGKALRGKLKMYYSGALTDLIEFNRSLAV